MKQSLRAAIFQYQCRDESPLDRLARLGRALEAGGAVDLVVCPELFLSGYNVGEKIRRLAETRSGPFAQAAAVLAKKRRTALVYGYPELADGAVYNAAICIGPDGETVAHHRKLCLPNAFERSKFAAGDGYTLFELNGWRVAILVCYDIEFPEAVRACAQLGAELVVAPTALRREWSFVAHCLVPARAFENGLYVAYANYCGREGDFDYLGESRFVSPTGAITSAADQETLITATLEAGEIVRARQALTYLQDCAILPRLKR